MIATSSRSSVVSSRNTSGSVGIAAPFRASRTAEWIGGGFGGRGLISKVLLVRQIISDVARQASSALSRGRGAVELGKRIQASALAKGRPSRGAASGNFLPVLAEWEGGAPAAGAEGEETRMRVMRQ